MYEYLNKILSPDDIKSLSVNELESVSKDIRDAIINRVSKFGGHFGSNMGIVETTVALHYVFNSPYDKLVFDVSHQCYTHKMITGRAYGFTDDNSFTKISGYTNPDESVHDIFNMGHTSTSISTCIGLCKARDLRGGKENVIAIIGDGSLSGGEALEGFNVASELNSNLIIVVNDNDMSIVENHGGLYTNLRNLRKSKGECECNLFKSFGLDYKYVDNGNDLSTLIEVFSEIKDINHPIVVHINTVKGKGSPMAENEKEKFHSTVSFNTETGELIPQNPKETYLTVTGDYILEKIKNDNYFVAISAGVPSALGFGFDASKRAHAGKQYIDVGIAEQTAVAVASGIAKNGGKALFGTYSSFIQRTYDQLSHDLCLNNSPATILVSNASIYGFKDKTHIGIFDIPLLSSLPNLVYLAPSSKEELVSMLDWSIEQNQSPVAIKMPGGEVFNADYTVDRDFSKIQYQITKSGGGVAILSLGCFYKIGNDLYEALKNQGINATLINPRFINILDKDTLDTLKEKHHTVVTLEDGILDGGFGEKIASYYTNENIRVLTYGLKKEYIDRYDPNEVLRDNGMTIENMVRDIIR
ncbi:MAG: 1-deoxy-D-xylulose-5-phosphate synthase [Clostridia bacterium]|nr:1-deoxy-D-xylulose-5-phosphate synthase [Clostridia bacterium]